MLKEDFRHRSRRTHWGGVQKAEEPRHSSDLDNVEDKFIRIVHQSLRVRDVKKGKGGDGRRRQNQKKKSTVKRTTNGGSSHTTKKLDQLPPAIDSSLDTCI